jgi:nitrite reductase/ring-hydroxylating ferredoxin subunit
VQALAEEAVGPAGVDVGRAGELRVDQMKLVRIGARRIVVACTETGYVAFDDRCTHKGGPLSDGVMACGTVQCPWHGSQFDVRSGTVKHGPAERPIATYPVEERGGRIVVRMPASNPAA